VLVVDDNVDAAQTLAAALSLHGQDVRTAYDGIRAMRIASEWRPEVAILDIGMRAPNGYELCRRIRRQNRDPQPLIVACTGWGQDEFRERASAAGFDHHLIKPVSPDAVLKLIAEAAGPGAAPPRPPERP
jgi:CheY-like chemotaxis protein